MISAATFVVRSAEAGDTVSDFGFGGDMKEYQSAKKPWARQVEAQNKMRDKEAFALLMAMRTGKTKVLLDNFGKIEAKGNVDDLLVIAPAGVYLTWQEAIDEHVGNELRNRLEVFVWSAQDGAKHKRELEKFLQQNNGPRVLVMNVEAFSGVERARLTAMNFIGQSSRKSMLVVDESTTIKSPSALRAKFISFKLAPMADYRRILSGLPTPKSPLDIYQQFYFLDPRILGHRNFNTFRARYAIIKKVDFGGRWPAPIVVGYRNVDEIYDLIEPYSYRATLEDCYDVPEKMHKFYDVKLTEEQEKIYQTFKAQATVELEAEVHVTATVVITQILRLHQILLGHVKDEMGIIREIKENRTAALVEILEEHEGKAIVWCSYDYNIDKICKALEKAFGKGTVARFWGGNRPTREAEEKRFLNDPNCLFMVATPAAGGRGRMWAIADLVIYYSNTNNLEHRSQSEDRAQAVGKERPVLYIDMRVPNTVEDRIIEGLRKKINLASIITGDNWKDWLI